MHLVYFLSKAAETIIIAFPSQIHFTQKTVITFRLMCIIMYNSYTVNVKLELDQIQMWVLRWTLRCHGSFLPPQKISSFDMFDDPGWPSFSSIGKLILRFPGRIWECQEHSGTLSLRRAIVKIIDHAFFSRQFNKESQGNSISSLVSVMLVEYYPFFLSNITDNKFWNISKWSHILEKKCRPFSIKTQWVPLGKKVHCKCPSQWHICPHHYQKILQNYTKGREIVSDCRMDFEVKQNGKTVPFRSLLERIIWRGSL
jgi:hypothetical protein